MCFGERRDAAIAQDVARPGIIGGEREIKPAEAVNLLAQIAAPRVHIGLGIERIDNAEHLLRPRHKLHEPLCALLRFSDVFEIGLHLDHRRDKPGIEPVATAGLGHEFPPDGGRRERPFSGMGAENQLRRHHARQGQRRRMGRQRVNVHLVEQVFSRDGGTRRQGAFGLAAGMHGAQALGRTLVRRELLMQDDARRSRAGYEHPRRQAKTQDADHSGSAK